MQASLFDLVFLGVGFRALWGQRKIKEGLATGRVGTLAKGTDIASGKPS
jgi:hypothetical protein